MVPSYRRRYRCSCAAGRRRFLSHGTPDSEALVLLFGNATLGMIKAADENLLISGHDRGPGASVTEAFALPLLHICKKRLRILLDFLLGFWIVL